MSEEATPAPEAAPEAAPAEASPAVEQLPDASNSGAEEDSFMSALDTAFESLDMSANPATATEPEPEVEQPAEPAAEATESFDPTDNINESLEDGWTPKAANRFKQLKAELKESTSEIDRYKQLYEENQQKIKELAGMTESGDVEALQEKIRAYEHAETFNNLEATEAYQTAITRPLNTLLDQSTQIADKYDLDHDDMMDLLSLSDPQEQDAKMTELMDSASDRDKALVYQIMNSIDPILQHRDQLWANAKDAMQEAQYLQEQQYQQQAAENLTLRQNVARNVVERVQQKLPFLSGIEGLDMNAIQAKAAETDPTVIHPVDYAYNSVSAQLLPSVGREYMSMRAEVESLTDRLAEYEGAEPTMSGSSSPTSQQVSGQGKEGQTFEESVNAAFAALG